MKDTIPESVTKDDFSSLCKKLIVEARITPSSPKLPARKTRMGTSAAAVDGT